MAGTHVKITKNKAQTFTTNFCNNILFLLLGIYISMSRIYEVIELSVTLREYYLRNKFALYLLEQ
jgi:NhaP-type Na+/H+ or K+/H+ antiporter